MLTATILDTNWMGRPHSIGALLLESQGHRAIIDPGPASTLETLREQLSSRGLFVRDIDSILVTHIHLDHAGAMGALVQENPRLAVFVHKNGVPHMADPSKLLASAGRLWGNQMEVLFGRTLPVPSENLRVLEGGETLTLGASKLEVLYTPGHASHHVSFFDPSDGTAAVGDTAGIRIDNGPYIQPAASNQFVAAARADVAQNLPLGEVDHYVFTAGLDLSFLGLARYLRKHAAAPGAE